MPYNTVYPRDWYKHPTTHFYDADYISGPRPTGSLNTPFAIPREASRTSGTAPLSVFFTAGFSPSDGVNRDFHDLYYAWAFDDPTSGTWAVSGKSKNIDFGGCASHLFETPGTYTVVLLVYDGIDGTPLDTDNTTFIIEVIDPDVTFAGALTTVINNIGDAVFTGKPTDATEVNTDTLSDISAYTGAGKRVLLKRGTTWTQSGALSTDHSGLLHIGAYGTGTNPDEKGIYTNAPVIALTGGEGLFGVDSCVDFRITDIEITGSATSLGVIEAVTNVQQLLVLRVKTSGHIGAAVINHWRNNETDQIRRNSFIECDFGETEVNCVYIGSEELAFMGNKVYNSKAGHVTRVWYSSRGVIEHNDLSGSSYVSGDGLHALKFHGSDEGQVGDYATSGGGGLPYRTRFTMVSNNLIGGSGPWPVSIGPQNAIDAEENLSDIIVEKNRVYANHGIVTPDLVDVSIIIEGRYHTIRNNILDGSGAAAWYVGISIAKRGIELSPLGTEVYSNTIYSGDAQIEVTSVTIHSANISGVIVKNNLSSFPNAITNYGVVNNAGAAASLSNNIDIDDPLFTNAAAQIFTLLVTSTAIDAGTSIPVNDDFADTVRTGTNEIGAYNF